MKTKLMIVDDNEEFLSECVAYFSGKEEYEVVATATNGEDALALIDQTTPDVLLLDLVMPKLDGYGVLEKISTTQKTIVMSALNAGNFVTKAISLGARYYMMKPFEDMMAGPWMKGLSTGCKYTNFSIRESKGNGWES